MALLHLLKLVTCEGLSSWSFAKMYALAKSSLVVLGYSMVKSSCGGGRREGEGK